MATTYDKASLVMIPSGYKDDKLYAVKPTDGSGDFTFSRDGAGASPATRVNASGLIEKGRTNELTYSNDFSNAAWTKSNTSVTGGQTGYDGSSEAWLLDKSASGGLLRQSFTSTGVGTISVYVKAGSLNWAFVNVGGAAYGAYFNLSGSGSVGSSVGATIEASIELIGSGWFRCIVAGNFSGATNFRIYPADGDNDTSGTSGNIYIQDAQLEQGLVATAPAIETTTAPVSAGLLGDMPRLDYSGGATCPSLLLEPSRVNSILQSEYIGSYFFYTNASASNNQTTSPEGVVNAASIIPDTTSGLHQIASSNISASGSFTLSAFVKAGELNKVAIRESNATGAYASFDLSTGTKIEDNVSGDAFIEPFANDWYRIGVTYTHSGNIRLGINVLDNSYTTGNPSSGTTYWSSNGTDKLYVYGLQCELSASYPTSYIPTYGSASTRGADKSHLLNSALLPTGYPFTLFCEIDMVHLNNQQVFSFLNSASSSNYYAFEYFASGGQLYATMRPSGSIVTLGLTDPQSISLGTHKLAMTITESTAKFYLDGQFIESTNSVPAFNSAIDDLLLGQLRISGDTGERTTTKQALVFPTALTDAEAIALTQI